ncbi:hypothetical protein ACX0G9_16120 [Flavitalea flava]
MPTKLSKRKKIEIILEKNGGLLWGRVEGSGNFMPTPYGISKSAVIENFKILIQDYLLHEGKDDPYWKQMDVNALEFEFSYDLEAYFYDHDYLKISSIAQLAGLNPGLVRQYASGVKNPSEAQADKIRKAITQIANELLNDDIRIAI